MRIRLVVELDVESEGKGAALSREQAQAAAVEAVTNALYDAEDDGYSHALAGRVSILHASVHAVEG